MRKKTTVIVNGNEKYEVKRKLLLVIALLAVLILMLYFTVSIKVMNKKFAEDRSNIYKLNTRTVFSIDKIYLYSSAGATKNIEHRAVWNINPYQFTDIAIYINNRSEEYFNYENTIKELYIDNVKFSGLEMGTPSLYYKNVNDFGKSIYTVTEDKMTNEEKSNESSNISENENSDISENKNTSSNVDTSNINAKISEQITKNAEKDKITDKLEFDILNDGDLDYSKPQIYTDCSHPITLEYINDIKQNHIISDINSDVIYNGGLLRKTGVVLSSIKCSVSFRITIINNYDQEFIANVYFEIPLEDTVTRDTIYNGKFVKTIEGDNMYKFLRIK